MDARRWDELEATGRRIAIVKSEASSAKLELEAWWRSGRVADAVR